MVDPVDAILAFHHAFRNDITRIDTAALNWAKGKESRANTIGRFRLLNEILVWHAEGEEIAVFPAVENVAPLVAEAYVMDHRGLDSAFDELNKSYSAHDLLGTARATAAFRFHLDMHLNKEDTHLYRIFRQRITLKEQAKAVGVLASRIPHERFSEVVAWLFPLIGHDDRENMVRIYQTMMPAPVFAGVKELIKTTIGNDYAELLRRIPTL